MSDLSNKSQNASVSVALNQARIEQKLIEFGQEGRNITAGEFICHELCRFMVETLGEQLDPANCVNVSLAISIGDKMPQYPVIWDAQNLDLFEFANQVKDLSLKYYRGELTETDFDGGTFTFVDLSSLHVVSQVPPLMGGRPITIGLCAVLPGTDTNQLVCTFDADLFDCATIAKTMYSAKQAVEE